MRLESSKPLASGGWIHRLSDPRPMVPPKPVKKIKDVSGLAMKMFRDKLASDCRKVLATKLAVSVDSLERLYVGIGWDWNGVPFASFPSRGVFGTIIGITRRYADGKKKTLAGTSNGIFAAENWWEPATGPIYVVEGASDVAALLTHELCALGRPSNTGGVQIIKTFLNRRANGRKVVVMGENDRKPERVGRVPQCPRGCEGCSWCWPGKYGAEQLAKRLGCVCEMPPPIFKDVREWQAHPDFM